MRGAAPRAGEQIVQRGEDHAAKLRGFPYAQSLIPYAYAMRLAGSSFSRFRCRGHCCGFLSGRVL